MEQFFKLPVVFKLTKTERLAACFVVSGDATADAIRVVRSVLVAISCHQLPSQRAVGHAGLLISKRILLSRVAEWSGREAVRAAMGMGRSGVRVRVEAASFWRAFVGFVIHFLWSCHRLVNVSFKSSTSVPMSTY